MAKACRLCPACSHGGHTARYAKLACCARVRLQAERDRQAARADQERRALEATAAQERREAEAQRRAAAEEDARRQEQRRKEAAKAQRCGLHSPGISVLIP